MTDQAPDTAEIARGKLHRRSFTPERHGPLHGIRVADMSRLVAGNMLSKVLADHGAEVIKVEPLAGDTLRSWRVRGVETAWKTWSRNKKSMCVDFRAEAGREAIHAVIRTAHVVIESFRPGVMEKIGFDPVALIEENPRLVVVRISGWGQTGTYRERPGFGTLIEGYSGFAAANGFNDREPVLPPMFLGDALAGLYGASALMIALRVAERDGVGQVIDLSLFDPMLAVLEPQIANYQLTRKVKPRTGSRSTNTAPRNVYRTRDDAWVCLSSATQGMAARLFASIGRAELIDDPRFATNEQRLANVEEVDRIVADFISSLTLDEALRHFERNAVTIGPIMDAARLVEDEFVADRESLVEVPDDDMGSLVMHGDVPRLSRTPGVLARPAPLLGEHTREILEPLLGAARLDELLAAGVLAQEVDRQTTEPK